MGQLLQPCDHKYRGYDCYVKWERIMYVTDRDGKQDKTEELSDIMVTIKCEIWELFTVISRAGVYEEEWE